MLGSPSHEEEDDRSWSDLAYQLIHNINPPPLPAAAAAAAASDSPTLDWRQLLIRSAEFISCSDFYSARRLLSSMSANSSLRCGDFTERLVHQFTRALIMRLNRYHSVGGGDTSTTATGPSDHDTGSSFNGGRVVLDYHADMGNPPATASAATAIQPTAVNVGESDFYSEEEAAVRSSYLALNQVTPYIRFSQLTANQAILEAVNGQDGVHILDLDIMHGLQWPPFMQAIAERCSNQHRPPPLLRITGTGPDLDLLRRTGDRLHKFAQSLGLKFRFHPLQLLNEYSPAALALRLPSAVSLFPEETLAVNCVHYLHRLLRDPPHDSRDLRLFLHKIKAMNPKVVTLAEREGSHNHPLFMQRFVEALDHYGAIFDSLEATLPPNSQERLAVEHVWFGREIMDIVAAEGDQRRERHERFESWEVILRSSGFSNIPLSPFNLSQAKLLLRLHYPSEGYQLQLLNDSLFLGWQNDALFSVSSWH
ncbi:hypothetical protein Nepgr_007742 [Nepenthes gracilis]|uniref:Scarecrow-like protein 18 n=1 Tax=Nepenthes gracilis TaxID=150966 RepID=A0AAD3S7F4_NEPGR|nr:hypothetical protein Nepgr_007742 [Nepenthes gracilis]